MLEELSPDFVAATVRRCFGRPAMPHLIDPAARSRAVEIARRRGLPERLAAELTDRQPIPVVPYSRFRDYARNGNRTRAEAFQRHRFRQIDLAALACLVGLDRLEYLHDLLWAECESTWWVMAAHERHGTPIDLRAALVACRLATVLTALADRIEPEVRHRVLDEIHRRVLRPFICPSHRHRWKRSTNNWNAVCIGNVLIAALLVEHEPARLAAIVADGIAHLPNFLAGFTPDGGCTEGPSYWRFGFGWFIRLAAALHDFTDGRIDIASEERVGRIARYPLSVALAPGEELTFADAHQGFQDPVTVSLINRFHDLPELRGLCALDDDGAPADLDNLDALLLYDGWTAAGAADLPDSHLPDLGIALLRAGPTALGAKAGHNAEHHNHNDVGSFIVFRNGTHYLADPGAPVYSARTFSDRRYESIFCNSLGHSVPVLGGRFQPAGARFRGTLTVEPPPEGKALRIDFADAYDIETLTRLERRIELAPDGREVRLADTFSFAGETLTIEEGFVTTCPVEVADDARSVTLRPENAPPATLSAENTPGRFAVREFLEESRAESRTGQVVRRITFTPDHPGRETTLRFALRF